MLKDQFGKLPVQAAILAASFLLFMLVTLMVDPNSGLGFLAPLIGILIAIEIFFFVGLEVKEGAKEFGWKHELVDTIIALALAVGIWYGSAFILNTETPVSGVVSCSMLPNLYRGDFVIVQGAPVRAYDIQMTRQELQSLNDRADIAYGESSVSIDGSLFPYCLRNSYSEMCRLFVQHPEGFVEEKGAFTYRYELCTLSFQDGSLASQPCLKSVEFHGKEYLTNFSHDTIIYQPPASDLYGGIGDIVHRVMFKIDADGESYYLTRGDNNPLLDLQVYDYGSGRQNRPVPEENVRGKVIARIPYLGYFKLFISGYFHEDSQCRQQLEFTSVG